MPLNKIAKTAKALSPKTQTIPKQQPCLKPALVPCATDFKTSTLPVAQKELYNAAWGNLYAAYLAKNASTAQNSSEWQALKRNAFINNPFCEYTPLGQDPKKIQQLDLCLDTPAHQTSYIVDCNTNIVAAYTALTNNYLAAMQTYLSPKTFPRFQNDSDNLHFNYATSHLNKALGRLSQTCSISIAGEEPVTHFRGSIADLGIIVNITNNSDRTFIVTDQDSYQTPIAHIGSGLNGVNLYTAALYQEPQEKTNSTLPACFSFFQLASGSMEPISNQPLFTVGIYTGAQLVAFLKTLLRKDPQIFDMNGCPTSAEFLAVPTDQYMVLIQDPTPTASQTRNLNQRIQAINLSVLTGPYLLTMQINEIIDSQVNPTTKQTTQTKILQPALTTVQAIHKPSSKKNASATTTEQNVSAAANNATSSESQNQSLENAAKLDQSLFPLIILPDYLWNMPNMQVLWMLYSTSYIAALTDFSCFGANKFGNAFEYFSELGYFNIDHEYRFIVDRYNLLKIGETLFDAPWLMGCGLYESSRQNCSDIPGIYSAQNAKGQMVANAPTFYNTNLKIVITPQSLQQPNEKTFKQTNFNSIYNMPYHQIYSLIFSVPTIDIKDSVFLEIKELHPNLFQFIWTNKKNMLLNTQIIRINFTTANIQINFLTNSQNWAGTAIHLKLNQTTIPNTSFKVMSYSQSNNSHTLTASPLLSIDKIETIHIVEFEKYPLTDLYFDLYNTVNIAPYVRCYMFNSGALPDFLQNLSQEDWQNGVYLIPIINHIKTSQLSDFAVTFYKADKKTILGTISSNISTQKPIQGYNLGCDQFNATVLEMYISTGILLKYAPIQQ